MEATALDAAVLTPEKFEEIERRLAPARERWREQQRVDAEMAELSAHVNAATARLLDLALQFRALNGCDEFVPWLSCRLGLSSREAHEYVRVAEALEQLPLLKAAFGRGELGFTKLRVLTRIATPECEQSLLELACVLTAAQLQRALRGFIRIQAEQASRTHQLEYVDYYWDDEGSLVLRARLAAEDGTLLLRVLEGARERVYQRRKAQRQAEGRSAWEPLPPGYEPERCLKVEALVQLIEDALDHTDEKDGSGRARLVVHIDADTLTHDAPGQSELEHGPVISPETARRLGCDSEQIARIEEQGLPVSVGRARRTVPPKLRRLLEARDQGRCQWPGCTNTRRLAAHHRTHWAHGGHTSLDNLILLCPHHHRHLHEGGYTTESGPEGEVRFRNQYGVLHPATPRPPPPGSIDDLIAANTNAGLAITADTLKNGSGERMNLDDTEWGVSQILH